jgi:hypothetical protein
MWRLHQHAITAKLPRQRTVLHMKLTGAGAAEGWLNIDRGAITVCKDNRSWALSNGEHCAVGGPERSWVTWSGGVAREGVAVFRRVHGCRES